MSTKNNTADEIIVSRIINIIASEISETISIREGIDIFSFLKKKQLISETNQKLIEIIIDEKREDVKKNGLEFEYQLYQDIKNRE